jgi:succinate dehydrogenase/fumarate reductase cytochrome b subunit
MKAWLAGSWNLHMFLFYFVKCCHWITCNRMFLGTNESCMLFSPSPILFFFFLYMLCFLYHVVHTLRLVPCTFCVECARKTNESKICKHCQSCIV